MKRHRNKTFKLSKGRRTRKQQLLDLEIARQDKIINRFSAFKDKTCNSRAMYAIGNIVKNKHLRTNESKSVNPPKSRFCAKVKREYQGDYGINDRYQISAKPKEWVRLRAQEVNALKVLSKSKYL